MNDLRPLRSEVFCWKLVCQDLQHTRRVRIVLHEDGSRTLVRIAKPSPRRRHGCRQQRCQADSVSPNAFDQFLRARPIGGTAGALVRS